MNDSISSVEFLRGCDDYYDTSLYQLAWDLNGDLIYETFGATAAFSAASLDGPTTAAVPVRVRHPYDGRIGTAAAAINVFNVPPASRVSRSVTVRDGR